MEFVHLLIKEEFNIESLVSLHYFEFARDFVFEGESHDFWEFLYVDKGEVEVAADKNGYILKQGDLIFHKPNEFHSVWANRRIAPNIVVVSFSCGSKLMSFFEGKIFSVGDTERNILADIVKEGFQAFHPPFDDPAYNTLIRRNDSSFGAEQMIKVHLQSLLITLVRKNVQLEKNQRISTIARERAEDDIIRRVEKYMKENTCGDLSLEDICRHVKMSRTQLAALFRRKKETGIISYFKNLKVNQAKTLIREENLNISEIAELLGYTSIHSFSRTFKNTVGMSPMEYAKSVKSRL